MARPRFGRQLKGPMLADHKISQFFGNNTENSDLKTVPDGVSPDSLNWVTGTEKDMIELRRGTSLLGLTRNSTAGVITGLGVGTRHDGVQVPFFTYGRKAKYYDADLDDTVEISIGGSTPVLPAAADGDEVSIFPYQNLAGAFVYLSSINSSVYKIPVANPGSAKDLAQTTFRGFLKFGQSRSILFNRKGTNGFRDVTGLYMSWLDVVSAGTYTQVVGEAVGALGSVTYNYTLAAITAIRTVLEVVVSGDVAAGTETFQDDHNGNLVSNFGGTGTINYATGAISVTFSAVTTGAVTVTYRWEDATSHGVVDFSFASPRVAGTGRFFAQFDGGGPLNAVSPLANIFYCFHLLKTWQTTIPTDDDDQGATPASNLPFRDKMGISYPYSMFGGSNGIYFINNSNPTSPQVYKLELFSGGATGANVASPTLISEALNLSAFQFDKAVIFEWGIYVLMSFQQIRNGVADDFNSRTFLYNKKSGTWDLLDYACSRLAEYNGTLISGDPLSNNIYTLFSGFDDDGSIIPNYWTSGATNHGVEGLKVTNRMVVDGLIQTAQNIEVDISLDGGAWLNVFTIEGTGSYVDSGQSISVGSYVEGSKSIGGGQTVFANPFNVEFALNSAKYQFIRVRFRATGGGFARINHYIYKDNRYKGARSLPERTVSN